MFRLLALFAMIATAQAACDTTALATCVTAASTKLATCTGWKEYFACYNGDCCATIGITAAQKTAFGALGCGTLACSATGTAGKAAAAAVSTTSKATQKLTFGTYTVTKATADLAYLRCGAANAYKANSCTGLAGTGCTVSNQFDSTTNITTYNVTTCTAGTVKPTFATGVKSLVGTVTASRRAGSAVTFVSLFLATYLSVADLQAAAVGTTFRAAFSTAMANLPNGFKSTLTAADITAATIGPATVTNAAASVAPAMATMAVVGVAALFH